MNHLGHGENRKQKDNNYNSEGVWGKKIGTGGSPIKSDNAFEWEFAHPLSEDLS